MGEKANSEPSTCSLPWDSFPGTFQLWGLSFLSSSQTLWFCITYILLILCFVPRSSGLQGEGGGERQREAMWIPPVFVSAWDTCSSRIAIASAIALLILLLKHPWVFFRTDEWEDKKQNKLQAAARNPREFWALLLPWDSFLSLWLERPSLQVFFATWCVLLGFGAQK